MNLDVLKGPEVNVAYSLWVLHECRDGCRFVGPSRVMSVQSSGRVAPWLFTVWRGIVNYVGFKRVCFVVSLGCIRWAGV